MAAIELPINDDYLSHVHQVRNANKAAFRAGLQAARARTRLLEEDEEHDDDDDDENEMSSSAATESTTAGSAFDLRASDSAVLSHYPTPLLRLLVLLSPVIDGALRFVQLATWTGGPGTASHSFILVLGWWAICLYGYEVIRYCPQFALLALLSVTGIVRAFNKTAGRTTKSKQASAASVNATIDKLAILADFCSTVYATLIAPLSALLCWHDVEQTFGLAVFLIASWPVWLLLFSGTLAQAWDVLQVSSIVETLHAEVFQRLALLRPHLQGRAVLLFLRLRFKYPHLGPYLDKSAHYTLKTVSFVQLYILPRIVAFTSLITQHAPDVLRRSAGPHVGFFPILSLRVRHLLLVLGTIALTWSSPWCALLRHALWRSALVRRTARFTWSCLSGQIFFGNSKAGRSSFPAVPVPLGGGGGESTTLMDEKKVTRHEDVVYQFTIFENQRWWMGLDWTAALLPQERPSWADESNNPVSPPSSFSLPPPKVTLRPTAKSTYTKRVVRWQWIDAEWTVAGRDAVVETEVGRRASTTSAASALSGASEPHATATDVLGDPTWRDVDAEGWQYGDNSWDKMSKKSGLGRYTRRRRWIRRAVLVELVQSDYLPSPDELAAQTATTNAKGSSNNNNTPLAAVPTSSGGESASTSRLAKTSANGESVGGAQNGTAPEKASEQQSLDGDKE